MTHCHFWNNYMTFGTGGTFGAKLTRGERIFLSLNARELK